MSSSQEAARLSGLYVDWTKSQVYLTVDFMASLGDFVLSRAPKRRRPHLRADGDASVVIGVELNGMVLNNVTS